MANCIITGCSLVRGGSWVHGDLHEEGGCYIFNAVLNTSKGLAQGEAAWEYDGEPQDLKVVEIRGNYFERRGVIVVSKAYARLNDAALHYLEYGA